MQPDAGFMRREAEKLSDKELIRICREQDLNMYVKDFFGICREELRKRGIDVNEAIKNEKQDEKIKEDIISKIEENKVKLEEADLEKIPDEELISTYLLQTDFCFRCGEELKKRGIKLAGMGTEEEVPDGGEISCGRCGVDARPGDSYCHNCGAKTG